MTFTHRDPQGRDWHVEIDRVDQARLRVKVWRTRVIGSGKVLLLDEAADMTVTLREISRWVPEVTS